MRILAVVPSCENLPSGHAIRPGDIVTALSGKTIEITNTDAEGRLILADALWYTANRARRTCWTSPPSRAGSSSPWETSTPASSGTTTTGAPRSRRQAEASGDHAWRLPLHERYHRYNDSAFADLKNSSD